MSTKPPAQQGDEPKTSRIELRVTRAEKSRVTRWAQTRGGISKAILNLIRKAINQ